MNISSDQVTIRRASEEEIPEVQELGVAAYGQYASVAPPAIFDAYNDDLRRLREQWNETEVWVAQVGKELGGSVLFYADARAEGLGLPEGWASFRKLAVRPDMRGRMIGINLVEKCVDRAREIGADAVGIHTVSFMEAACSIYERMGFQRCPHYDAKASDMLSVDGEGEIKLLAFSLQL